MAFSSPGGCEYRRVVDGEREADSNNEAPEANALDGFSSVIHLCKEAR
jgi:hypothetical protein